MSCIFYNRIKEQADLRNISINKIEKDLGYPRNALHNYKNNGEPSATRLLDLADYFKVSPYYLLGRQDVLSTQEWKKLFNTLPDHQKIEFLKAIQTWFLEKVETSF